MPHLDHIMYSCSDLDLGSQYFASLLGVEPAFGGVHIGKGTQNALFSLNNNQYFEIIAPDPNQNIKSEFVSSTGIKTWAVASNDLLREKEIASSMGLGSNLIAMSRGKPDGGLLEWELLFVSGHEFGYQFPFFINWLGDANPSETTPQGCALKSFTIKTQDTQGLQGLIEQFGIEDILIEQGTPAFEALLSTPKGNITIQ